MEKKDKKEHLVFTLYYEFLIKIEYNELKNNGLKID